MFIGGFMNLDFLVNMAQSNPKLIGAMAIAYAIGLGAKILRSAVETYIEQSESKKDDAGYAKIKENKIFKAAFYVVDLLLRLKKPEQPK